MYFEWNNTCNQRVKVTTSLVLLLQHFMIFITMEEFRK